MDGKFRPKAFETTSPDIQEQEVLRREWEELDRRHRAGEDLAPHEQEKYVALGRRFGRTQE